MARLFPSLMGAKLLNIGSVIAALEPYCNGFHIDVMDDHFVPNITFGVDMVNAIAKASQKPCWVHLMIDKPVEFIKNLNLKVGSIITFHQEVAFNLKDIIDIIRARDCKVSIALKPATSVGTIAQLLPLLDQILIMSVEPGFSGQKYMVSVESKFKELVMLRKNRDLTFRIGIDGGITASHIQRLKQLGIDDFAIAAAIFDKPDYTRACVELKELMK